MNGIIRIDVPEWQIGKPVTVYFPDTMMKKGVCEPAKEQEPKLVIESIAIGKNFAPVCPTCGRELGVTAIAINTGAKRPEYCMHCGQEVKWEL